MFNDDDLKRRWDVYSKRRETAGDPLDGTPDFDLRLYVRFKDREPDCSILRPDNLKEFADWREHNPELIKKAMSEINSLRKSGKGHYSISGLVGHFRHFETVIQTDPNYHINDHVGPLLARYCIFLEGTLRDFFELRSPSKRRTTQAITDALVGDVDMTFTLDWDEAEWLEIGRQVRDELLTRFGAGEKEADVA